MTKRIYNQTRNREYNVRCLSATAAFLAATESTRWKLHASGIDVKMTPAPTYQAADFDIVKEAERECLQRLINPRE